MATKAPKNRKREPRTPIEWPKLTRSIKFGLAAMLGLGVGAVFAARHAADPRPSATPQASDATAQDEQSVAARIERQPIESAPGRPPKATDFLGGASLDPAAATLEGGRFHQVLGNERVTLTLIPELQERAQAILREANVPYGAVVAVEPSTGKVLAMVSFSSVDAALPVALQATQPAASIFKVITGAALVEEAGLGPNSRECVRGGRSGISADLLTPNPQRDTLCHTLGQAMGHSTNTVFARLADRHLSGEKLEKWATSFGFGAAVPFALPVEASRFTAPSGRVDRAGAAAGFHHSTLSPLHGALVAAAIGYDGVMMEPELVESIERNGVTAFRAEARPWRRAVSPTTAQALATMMRETARDGTATKHIRRSTSRVQRTSIAGKTGSLSSTCADGKRRHNSWFIGFAPAESPTIAIAALVVNDPKWTLKSTPLALGVLDAYLAQRESK
jgi:cell division protein FtsI/penicillin-binding protein 2